MESTYKTVIAILRLAIHLLLRFFAGAVELLADSVRTTPADDELSSSIRGGIMNHRTGMFDDGSDPAGWYERD